jgi:hypothetical protein
MASRARTSSTPSATRSLPVEVGDDPVRWLVPGPDQAGNLLELVVMDRPAGQAGAARDRSPAQAVSARRDS